MLQHLDATAYTSISVTEYAATMRVQYMSKMEEAGRRGFDSLWDHLQKGESRSEHTPVPHHHVIRIEEESRRPNLLVGVSPGAVRPLSLEARIRNALGDCVVHVSPVHRSSRVKLDVLLPSERSMPCEAMRVLHVLTLMLAEREERRRRRWHRRTNGIEGRGLLYRRDDLLEAGYILQLTRVIFREIFERKCRLEMRAPRPRFPITRFYATRQEARSDITSLIAMIGKARQFAAKRDEWQALRKAIAEQQAKRVMAVVANTLLFGEDGRTIGEIDGLLIGMTRKRLRLRIIEATDQRQSSAAKIERQLHQLVYETLHLRDTVKASYGVIPMAVGQPHAGCMEIVLV